MPKYTIIGRYYDNEQGIALHVSGTDEDDAIFIAQSESHGYDEEDNCEPLEIVAVLASWAEILQTRDV